MFKIILCVSTLISLVIGNGELSIVHNPDSIEFKGNENLEPDTIPEIFSAALGYSVENPSGWSGLYIREPFNMPKAVVAVVVEGVEELKISQGKSKTFSVIGSLTSESIDSLLGVVEQHDDVIEIDLNQGFDSLTPYDGIFGSVKSTNPEKPVSSLKPQLHPEDKLFLQQLDVLDFISNKLYNIEKKPSLIIVRVSLTELINAHQGSPAVTDALKLLSSNVEKLTTSAEKAYGGNVVVAVLANKEQYRRTRRDVAAEIPATLNLADNYSEDYPAVFNIILWFGVAFVFSLLAICIVIATMDPGRDSIIYRMTLNRMKKEN